MAGNKKRRSSMPSSTNAKAASDGYFPATISDFIDAQQRQDLLRFITCGSVDDGKSTLIGRLLWEANQITEDQLKNLAADSRKYGGQGEGLDFALLVDGLSAEREQGITIDVAYRYFSTPKRKFIVADTPGHEQYTRNMVTGASTADAAVLLVNASLGLLTQTRRHAFLASLLGIRHLVLVINKMDLVAFSEKVFSKIKAEFESYVQAMGFTCLTTIPVCAVKGDNISLPSPNTPWYAGPTLMAFLESMNVEPHVGEQMVFPVQWVTRTGSDFRGFSGAVAQGRICLGDEIRVSASGQTAVVTGIVSMDGDRAYAMPGEAVTLCLDKDIDISRGDVISLSQFPLDLTDQFEATLVWLHQEEGLTGRGYDLKLANQWASASITNIKHRVDVGALTLEPSKGMRMNDISTCTLSTSKPLVFDEFSHCKELGSFILVDRFTHATVAAGMIKHNLRRAQNIRRQSYSLGLIDRERLNGHQGQVIWFTGLSGSGKSTLANALEVVLHTRGLRTYVLDGDNVRHGLNKDLGFTEADRVENIRRIAEVARLMMDAGLIVMTAFIAPYARDREMARELIGIDRFFEVYVSTPLDVCEKRDVKGLYRKARKGEIPNMTGINSPYEAPEHPHYEAKAGLFTIDAIVRDLAKMLLAA